MGDGNCLFRAFAYFINNDENNHNNIRHDIYQEGQKRKSLIPNIIIETERDQMYIHNYLDIMNEDRIFGGDLEISLAYDIYKFNIAVYKEKRDINGKLINLNFLYYINNDNNENKDLCILTTINDNHYNLAFYNNNKNIDLNHIPKKIQLINNNKEKINEINPNNQNYDDVNLSKENINENELNNNIIEKYEFKNLNNYKLDDILKFYSYEEGNSDNLADIYYYKFNYQLSGNRYGKYTESFIKKNNNNLRLKKKQFKARIKNYNIGKDKILKKFVKIKDPIDNEKKIIN